MLVRTFALAATFAIGIGFATSSMAQASPNVAGCAAADFVDAGSVAEIKTAGRAYTPKCLRVKAGSTVTIAASGHHPLNAMPDVEGIENPFQSARDHVSSQSRRLDVPGLYGYYCTAHGDDEGDGMAGVIWVVE